MTNTEELSIEAYEAIIVEAGVLDHKLTSIFGALSNHCPTEAEFLEESEKLANEILYLDSLDRRDYFLDRFPSNSELDDTLKKIISNIEEVKKIPIEQRNFE